MTSRPRFFWFSGALIIGVFFALLMLLGVIVFFASLLDMLWGGNDSSLRGGVITKGFFLFLISIYCCYIIWNYIYKCSRYVVVRNGIVFVRYLFNPERNYSLKLSDMKSFFIREYSYEIKDRFDRNWEFRHYQVYLRSKENDVLWLYVDSNTCGNFEKMINALQNEGNLKEEKKMISLSSKEEKKAWKGNMIRLNGGSEKSDKKGEEKLEQDEDAFEDKLDELLKMVEKEGGLDVWDYLENMCLISITREMGDQLMKLLSVLDSKEQQEILDFFHPFDMDVERNDTGLGIILERNNERRARLSTNLGMLARTPQFKKMKKAPEWQKLRDIINKDRRECNQKEL